MSHPDAGGPAVPPSTPHSAAADFWRRNVRYLAVLLTLWFILSFGFAIVWVEPLNRFRLPGTGFPLGFWFAQQGAIYAFLLIIVAYVWLMNRLDRAYDARASNARAGDAEASRGAEHQ